MAEPGRNLQLCEIAPSDLQELARFIGRVSKSDTPSAEAVRRLEWMLLENPARAPGDALGWLLRAPSGNIVACMCCTPQKFCCGHSTFNLMMANSFYVDEEYRGAGTSIFLKYLQLARRYPLFVSSANATVSEIWRKLGGYPLGDSDREVLGILRWPPLLAERVYRKTGSDTMASLASTLASPFSRRKSQLLPDADIGELLPLASAEEAARFCAPHSSAQQEVEQITSCRDAAFLKWRYFSAIDPTTRLFVFNSRDSGAKPVMVAVCLRSRGYQQQISALQVLDLWPQPDPATCLQIIAALWCEYREQIDILVLRCLSQAHQQALATSGFRTRTFAAPIAWCIDKYGLLPTKNWYFVPADGDMFL